MATKAPVSVEQYLRMSFEGADCEFVDGDIVERHLGEDPHSEAQWRLGGLFYNLAKQLSIHGRPEIRLRVSENRYRVADFALFRERPTEYVPSTPPLAVIEIVSRDDRYTEISRKLAEYREWGVPHVWLVDPWLKKLYVSSGTGLTEVAAFEIPEHSIKIPSNEIF